MIQTLYQALSKRFNAFFYSYPYILLVALIGGLGFYYEQELLSIFVLCSILAVQWIFIRDLTPTAIAMMVIAMVPLARYGEVGYFVPTAFYVLPILVPSFLIHLLIYPPEYMKGRFYYPTLAVAVAISLGGLFSPFYLDNFKGASLYYFFFLGVFMVMIYQFQENYTPNKKGLHLYFAKMMIGVGLMGLMMVVSFYIKNWDWLKDVGPGNHYQWRNNLSNNLLISMPFAFYMAYKSKLGLLYFLFGTLQFLALLVSYSRGGILFGTFTFGLLVIATFVVSPKRIPLHLFLLAVLGGSLYWFSETYVIPVSEIMEGFKERIVISGEESRAEMFRMALRNFWDHPLFGVGLGFNTSVYYDPQPMGMYWYHSTVSQVIGSFGIIGILAYGYQTFMRVFTLVEKRTVFNLFVAGVFIGFGGYSLVNVGYFIPLPMVALLLQMMIIVERTNKRSEA